MISERLEASRPASRANKPRTTRLEIDWRPESRHDLSEVVEAWDDAGYDDNNWAGVKTSDGRMHRFDDNLCREPVEVSEEIGADPRWSKETLERAWEHSRDQVEVLVSKLRKLNE